jgi:putative nucleotidyltransferase with HDIG domain
MSENNICLLPAKDEAESILTWAYEQNPGQWVNHCRVVARAAEAIAKKCELDTQRAYVSGLLHDVGRYEGVCELHHVYAGYELLKNK